MASQQALGGGITIPGALIGAVFASSLKLRRRFGNFPGAGSENRRFATRFFLPRFIQQLHSEFAKTEERQEVERCRTSGPGPLA